MARVTGFIDRHGLWSDDQRRQAAQIKTRISKDRLKLFRVAWADPHGGGMGLDEMTGSPNLVIVPDPATFRVLPWEPEVGWILCDEYFLSGVPFHFSPRRLLRKQLDRL